MRLVCMSDTHSQHESVEVPDGDVFVHSGDYSSAGSQKAAVDFATWLSGLPHQHKVVTPGNHDWFSEKEPAAAALIFRKSTYLVDEAREVGGFKFYGAPWSPRFFDWAFNADRGAVIRSKWARIPDDTQVLVVHGPPAGILDRTRSGETVGCADLLNTIENRLSKLRLVVFGHIHEAHGTLKRDGVLYVNASTCDLKYRPVQPPVVVDLSDSGAEVVSE